jgi:predicted nucleic acid-binding protein
VLTEARAVAGDVDLVVLDPAVRELARDIGGPQLRTLGALHLASAVLLGEDLTALAAYDSRFADAARELGLVVVAPGQER